jgi:hypothetical protein
MYIEGTLRTSMEILGLELGIFMGICHWEQWVHDTHSLDLEFLI